METKQIIKEGKVVGEMIKKDGKWTVKEDRSEHYKDNDTQDAIVGMEIALDNTFSVIQRALKLIDVRDRFEAKNEIIELATDKAKKLNT